MDPIELTKQLIALDTINPPGHEARAADLLTPLLEEAGFTVDRPELAPGRPNLIARSAGDVKGPWLAFTGHMDTVPPGEVAWSRSPLEPAVEGNRLFGRGSSDMKSGLAAMTAAAIRLAGEHPSPPILLVYTAAEETGCEGAAALTPLLPAYGPAGALVVGEPTANLPYIGHKGVLWLRATAHGRAAHGSRPDLGENAILKLAEALMELEREGLSASPHPILGQPTVNVGLFRGGSKINIVPDRAEAELDFRTVPGHEGQTILDHVTARFGDRLSFELIEEADCLLSDPDDPWLGRVFDRLTEIHGRRPPLQGLNYFTDASVLTPALGGVPTVILGPGEPDQAHQTDEYCLVENISQAAEIYYRLGRDWIDQIAG